MIFVFPITTPKNTPQTAPQQTDLQLTQGKITHMQIQYPLGVNAVCNIVLKVGLFQLFPTNTGNAFATSNETITWDDDFDLDTGANVVTAITWNTSVTNPHTLTVRFTMEPLIRQVDLAAEIAKLIAPGVGV